MMKIENQQSIATPRKQPHSYFKDFCETTTIHGWYFFGKTTCKKKPSLLRIFWIVVLGLSIGAAVFVMGTTVQGETDFRF